MFTWICPQCGREVPPSYGECPQCVSRAAPRDGPRVPVSGATGGVKPAGRPKRKFSLPSWLLTLLYALAFGAIGYGAYIGYRHFSGSGGARDGDRSPESAASVVPERTPSILGKYIEVAGLRLTEDSNRNPEVRFLVVNHSGAEIGRLSGNVILRPATGAPEDPPVGTFSFTVPSLAPYEAKDMSEKVDTTLRAYELPDWQFLRADVKLTSP